MESFLALSAFRREFWTFCLLLSFLSSTLHDEEDEDAEDEDAEDEDAEEEDAKEEDVEVLLSIITVLILALLVGLLWEVFVKLL